MEVSFENYWLSLWNVEAKYKPTGWELYSPTPLHPIFDAPLTPRQREALEKFKRKIPTAQLDMFLKDYEDYEGHIPGSEWDRIRNWFLWSIENALRVKDIEALEPLEGYLNIRLLASEMEPALTGSLTKGTIPTTGSPTQIELARTMWEYALTKGYTGDAKPFFYNCNSLFNKNLYEGWRNKKKKE